MNKIILSIIFFSCGLFLHQALADDKIPQPVEWESPLSKVSDLNLDYKEIINLIGENGQFTFARDPRSITTWTKKGVNTFQGEYVVTNMKVVHAPLEKVRDVVKDYSIIEKVQSQHTNVKFVSKKNNHILYSFKQVYDVSIMKLKCDFLVQQTIEEDGSISIMLHEGDVDAQVLRWEFIPLDDNRTVVSLTFWAGYDTARFMFQIFLKIAGIPESHLMATIVYSTMYLKQYADYIDKEWLAERALRIDENNIHPEPQIPLYEQELSPKSKQLIEALVTKGKVYTRTYQSAMVQGKEMHDLMLVSVFDDINVPVEHAEPYITDITNFTDSTRAVTSMKLRKAPYEKCYRSKVRYGKFPFVLPLSVDIEFSEANKNSMSWKNPGLESAFVPFSGRWEWQSLSNNNDATFFAGSLMIRVGPDANFFVNLVNKAMPDAEAVMNLAGWTIMTLEERRKWIEKTYRTTEITN